MVQPRDFQSMFLAECTDHLRVLAAFADGAAGRSGQIDVDDAFRAVHSIKGGAAMFGPGRAVPVAHQVETLLDIMRRGSGMPDDEAGHALQKAVDCLADLIEAEGKGLVLPTGFETIAMERLARFLPAQSVGGTTEKRIAGEDTDQGRRSFRIRFRPHEGLLKRANEPLLLMRELRSLGLLKVRTDCSGLPDIDAIDPGLCYLAWDMTLETGRSLEEVRAVFEFVEGDGLLEIAEGAEEQDTFCQPAHPAAVPQSMVEGRDVAVSSIRVETEKIDRLVNLVGEIAIAQAQVAQLIDQTLFNANPRLFQELSQLLVHTQTLHDSVMSVRAQPVRTVFERMRRLVRELGEQLGKSLTLRISGEATEIDKTVIEEITDPVMHMIRNAADHGIERADERRAAGKPSDGVIALHAEQRGSRIVIAVSDDGRGLDRERIRRTALERGLISAGAALSAEQIDNFIFLPGFSTAPKVTMLSGRGVGMDVVKSNVQKFGGRVSVRSESGRGTTMTLSLPLTLAVLEGMILACGRDHYVLPVTSILECRADWRAFSRDVPGLGRVLDMRGRLVPVFDLQELLGRVPAVGATQPGIAVVAETEEGEFAAFIIDEIAGQQQIVVKKMASSVGRCHGISGATILGDGRVALILDPAELAERGRSTFEAKLVA